VVGRVVGRVVSKRGTGLGLVSKRGMGVGVVSKRGMGLGVVSKRGMGQQTGVVSKSVITVKF
jgi:hypothetical protein